MAVLKLSVIVKNTQEAPRKIRKEPISQRLREVHWPSLVRRGAKMVKARMVAVGKRTLSLAVPLRIALMI